MGAGGCGALRGRADGWMVVSDAPILLAMSLTRRHLLASGLAAAGCAASPGKPGKRVDDTGTSSVGSDTGDRRETTAPSTPSGPPNILYIYLDQIRWDTLGCAGHPVVLTPHIDALAAEGVRFSRCYTNSPLCMPARAVMTTGRLPGVTGVVDNLSHILPSGPSHVRRMADAGYSTGVVGKVHLLGRPGHKDGNLGAMAQLGYTHAVETAGARKSAEEPSRYTDWLSATSSGPTDKYARYIDYIEEYLAGPHASGVWLTDGFDEAGFRLADHLDAFIARRARALIRSADGSAPWYLQVNFVGPHPPWDATSAFRGLYDAADPRLPVPVDRDPVTVTPLVQRVLDGRALPRTEEQKRETLVRYYARSSMVDHFVGEVMASLRASGQDANTWVILHADHGEQAGEKNLVGKMVFFEPSVRVPLVVRPPGGVDPWVSSALCDQLDVTQTILELGGAPLASDGVRSLVSTVLAGPADPAAHTGKAAVISQVHSGSMVVMDTLKVTFDDDEATEVYDLDVDPGEWDNQVAAEGRAADLAGARDILAAAMADAES